MEKGYVQVFCGSGEGKSSAALGKGLIFASEGKNVIIVQFMKEKSENEERFFQRLEPEIKMFRFEKKMTCFSELSDEEKKEEITNIKNGLNYAKKVLTTGECDLLILDEVLGLIDEGVIDCSELIPVLASKSDNVNVLLTGIVLSDELKEYVDYISNIESLH